MAERLADVVEKVRSKNAGPFWLTIDIFCGTDRAYERVSRTLATPEVARLLGADTQLVKRFDIAGLNVVKFSLPRPHTQGAVADRDMHGAAWAVLLAEMALGETD